MQLGGRKGIRPVKTWGGYGGGVAVSSVGVAPTWTVGASASIFFLCSTKPRRFFMMAYNNDIGLDPVGVVLNPWSFTHNSERPDTFSVVNQWYQSNQVKTETKNYVTGACTHLHVLK